MLTLIKNQARERRKDSFLDDEEIEATNPLFINLYRADIIRKYKGLPRLLPDMDESKKKDSPSTTQTDSVRKDD